MSSSRTMLACTFGMTFLSLLLIPPASAQLTEAESESSVEAQIELFSNWMEGQIEIRNLPGIVVGVISGDDLVWAKGFGYADLESERAMETTTRFRMASHSKLFTATAIMQQTQALAQHAPPGIADVGTSRVYCSPLLWFLRFMQHMRRLGGPSLSACVWTNRTVARYVARYR